MNFWNILNASAWLACIVIAGLLIYDIVKVEMNKKAEKSGE